MGCFGHRTFPLKQGRKENLTTCSQTQLKSILTLHLKQHAEPAGNEGNETHYARIYLHCSGASEGSRLVTQIRASIRALHKVRALKALSGTQF